MVRTLRSIALLLGLSFGIQAHAALISYNFSGVLGDTFGSLSAGDAFSGTYSFDSSVAASGNASFAVFNNLTGVSFSSGSFSASIGPGSGLPEIQQDDVAGADRYALLGRNPVGSAQIGGLDITAIGFRLDDTSGTAINDATVLLTDLSLTAFTSNSLLLFFGEVTSQDFTVVSGRLTSLNQVPEPASLALSLVALAACALLRRTRI